MNKVLMKLSISVVLYLRYFSVNSSLLQNKKKIIRLGQNNSRRNPLIKPTEKSSDLKNGAFQISLVLWRKQNRIVHFREKRNDKNSPKRWALKLLKESPWESQLAHQLKVTSESSPKFSLSFLDRRIKTLFTCMHEGHCCWKISNFQANSRKTILFGANVAYKLLNTRDLNLEKTIFALNICHMKRSTVKLELTHEFSY
jgi:hypothetical protein